MDYFPAFLNIRGRPCLLVGGGVVASRKADSLLAAGASLTVVAPEIGPRLERLAASGRITHLARGFRTADLTGYWLVVNAGDDRQTGRRVFEAADEARVFCNSVDDAANCSYLTPAIVDRSPVVVAVSSGGAAPLLVRKIRAQIETILPARIGRLAALAGEWRERVKKRFHDSLGRRRFWELMVDGPVHDDVLAGRMQSARQMMASLLDSGARSPRKEGEVWLVGAGPGDPGLLTMRAFKLMQRADVIVHDRLVSEEILALARRDAEKIPVGKSPGCKSATQEEINELLVRLARDGKRVCRLKGGDPFIFGRGGEEMAALGQAGIRNQVVPGITAAAGCAAYAGIPLTHRDMSQSVAFLTAHGKDSVDRLDWRSLARDRQTLVLYMAVRRFGDIQRHLIRHGRGPHTPIAIIERGTTDDQRVIHGRLDELTGLAGRHDIVAPAILVIGEVADFATSRTRFEGRSAGQTRPSAAAAY
ncbi:MAG: siroheme synthase CysG [Woeseia sp.]